MPLVVGRSLLLTHNSNKNIPIGYTDGDIAKQLLRKNMQVNMISSIIMEVTTDNGFKYEMTVPFGSPYIDAFVAIETFKQSIEQMQKNAMDKSSAEEIKKEE